MAGSSTRPKKTLEDLLALGEDVRAELIAGEIHVTPAPDRDHQTAVVRLVVALETHARRTGGLVFVAPFDVYLPSGDVVQPDVLWVSESRTQIVTPRGVEGAPDLIVEVLSRGNPGHDRRLKFDLYARNGVGEIWLVDPRLRKVDVFRLEATSYRAGTEFCAGTDLVSASLPDLRIPVGDLFPWQQADRS